MNLTLSRRQALLLAGAALTAPLQAQTTAWPALEKKARGQTVYFNAWAGSQNINAYLQWAGAEVQKRFGVTLVHVKITDTAEVVKRVRNEKTAGKLSEGSVDLVWINGENFLAMKREKLLFGPFAESLPHFALVDVLGKPTTRLDFSEPVEGMEAPWGMAQLTFYTDTKRVPKPPQSMAELLAFAKAHPGRLTYPRVPDFMGATFLKQALLEVNTDRGALYQAVTPEALAKAAAPLWTFLDTLHPHLWRAGKQFPNNAGALRQMMADGELLLGFTFNPNEAANEIAAKRMAASVTSYQFSKGTIGNTHFLAIPFNATAQAGAQVVANFLLSAEAQARKADIAQWGDPTVLAMGKLPPADQALFTSGRQIGQVEKFMPTLPEPHGSWTGALEREWIKRYAQ
jgi:putative thiamine transport system substrate-binding protein